VYNVKSPHTVITKDMVNEVSTMNQSICNDFVPFVFQSWYGPEDAPK